MALEVTSFDEVAEEVTLAMAMTGTTKVAAAKNFLKFVRIDLLYLYLANATIQISQINNCE